MANTRVRVGLAVRVVPRPPPAAAPPPAPKGTAAPTVDAAFNPGIMHAAVSPDLHDYVVQPAASAADLARFFRLPEALVAAAWVADETPSLVVDKALAQTPPRLPRARSATPPARESPRALAVSLDARLRAVAEAMRDDVDTLAFGGCCPAVAPTTTGTHLRNDKCSFSSSSDHPTLDDLVDPFCRPGPRCGWIRPPTGPADDDSDAQIGALVSGDGLVAARKGRCVYRGLRLSATLPVAHVAPAPTAASFSSVPSTTYPYTCPPTATYAELQVIIGGGICVGVVDADRPLSRLVGTDPMDLGAVGFHDSGRLVRGPGEWSSYCAPFRSGDTVGILIAPAATCAVRGAGFRESYRAPQHASPLPVRRKGAGTFGLFSTSGIDSGTSSDASSPCMRNSISVDSQLVASRSAVSVAITFFVNGIAGPAIVVETRAKRLAVAVSLYSNETRVRAACCESRWKYFPQAARAARPAVLGSICAITEAQNVEHTDAPAVGDLSLCAASAAVARVQPKAHYERRLRLVTHESRLRGTAELAKLNAINCSIVNTPSR